MVRRDQTNEEQRGGAPSSNGASRHAARNTASTSLREPENAADRFAWAEQLALRPRAIFATVQLGSPAVMFHFMQPTGPAGGATPMPASMPLMTAGETALRCARAICA